MSEAVLEVQGLSARYGNVCALHPVDLTLGRGELVAVLGPNGAGKSTLLRAIMGLTAGSGRVLFEGAPLARNDARAVTQQGVILVPEGRGVFGPMTVRENLDLGAYLLGNRAGEIAARLERVFALFPRLKDRQTQLAGSLSGGEQQMLAIGRAMMAGPRLLLLDEPSLGLAPRLAAEILETLGDLNRGGLPILLVEQRAPLALKLAKRAYLLSVGRVVAEVTPDQIASPHDLARYYFAAA
ncbi:MAG: ABC transporter ATP-binding protein [Burkholderiales bacterium]|nr:ABC transporter ATP-binding protein [Burkholderiales bacterium]